MNEKEIKYRAGKEKFAKHPMYRNKTINYGVAK